MMVSYTELSGNQSDYDPQFQSLVQWDTSKILALDPPTLLVILPTISRVLWPVGADHFFLRYARVSGDANIILTIFYIWEEVDAA